MKSWSAGDFVCRNGRMEQNYLVAEQLLFETTCCNVSRCIQLGTNMTETLSIRIDSETKKRLDALSKRSRRSKSFLAAEAITAFVESEEWQLGEVHKGLEELDSGLTVNHDKVSEWLKSWGKVGETKAPR